MSPEQIIRAWKDEDYRNGLSADQRAQLPDHPANWVELTDSELQAATGGRTIPPISPKPRTPLCPGKTDDCTSNGPQCPTSFTNPTCIRIFCDQVPLPQ